MDIEGWASSRSAHWRQTFDVQEGITSIKDLLEGATTAEEAAKRATSAYETSIKQYTDLLPASTLFETICDAAQSFADSEEARVRLLDLMDSIQRQTMMDEHGNLFTHGGQECWKHLPGMTMAFRDFGFNVTGDIDIDETSEEWYSQAPSLLNMTSFAAAYLMRGGNMAYFAEIELKLGTEQDLSDYDNRERTRMFVPPVATWILIAGRKIYQFCLDKYNHRDSYTTASGRRECRGYSLTRWSSWKWSLKEIALTNLHKDVTKYSTQAATEMEATESEYTE